MERVRVVHSARGARAPLPAVERDVPMHLCTRAAPGADLSWRARCTEMRGSARGKRAT